MFEVASRDATHIIARIFAVPPGRALYVTDQLRAAGVVPGQQGLPIPLSRRQIATLLVAVLLGPSGINKAKAYAASPNANGDALADRLAELLEKPAALNRFQLDHDAVSAMIDADTGIEFFGEPGPTARVTIVTGGQLSKFVDALHTLPPRRAGRPRNSESHT